MIARRVVRISLLATRVQLVVLSKSLKQMTRYCHNAIRTRWLEVARIHHNRIIAKKSSGYGYKVWGHTKVRFDHNFFDTNYFAYESPFETSSRWISITIT